ESVAKQGRGSMALSVKVRRARRRLTADELLLATGRVPNTDELNAAAAGVALDKNGYIKVDDYLATSAKGVYAIGDVKRGPAFTHIGWGDSRCLEKNLVGGGGARIAGRLVPYTVYIDPQLGRVGMSETEARESGRHIKITTMPMSSVARAIETAETRGFLKVVVDAKTDQILGAAVLGIEGGEIMSALQLAMMGKLPSSDLPK